MLMIIMDNNFKQVLETKGKYYISVDILYLITYNAIPIHYDSSDNFEKSMVFIGWDRDTRFLNIHICKNLKYEELYDETVLVFRNVRVCFCYGISRVLGNRLKVFTIRIMNPLDYKPKHRYKYCYIFLGRLPDDSIYIPMARKRKLLFLICKAKQKNLNKYHLLGYCFLANEPYETVDKIKAKTITSIASLHDLII